MSTEEHFRRLKNDEGWQRQHDSAPTAVQQAEGRAPRRDRGPIWATAVVGAAVVLITVAAVQGARPAAGGGSVGAPAAGPVTTSAVPALTSSPTPSDPRSVDPSDPALRWVMFYPDDPADMSRAKKIIACFKTNGVRIVGLVPSFDDPNVDNIGYGGPQNDHESIMTALKYQTECFKAGGPAE